MATELLERMVIGHFDEFSVDYRVLADHAVKLALPSRTMAGGSMEVLITDEEVSGAGLFSVMVLIAEFPESQMRRALDISNAVSRISAGKFTVAEDGTVTYCLNWPVADSAEPEDTRLMLSFAAQMVDRHYPAFMAVRWGNATVEEALAGSQDKSPEDGGMSDDELRRLLEGLGLEDCEDDS